MSTNVKYIFTFLNFKNFIPAYLKLCIETWIRNLDESYQIIILSPNNINQYIDKKLLTESVINPAKPFSPFFNDYISFLVLYCQGGFFLDADTILTDFAIKNFNLFNDYDFVLFTEKENVSPGFIMAQKHTPILEELILRYRIENYFLPEKRKRNYILNDVISNYKGNNMLLVDNQKSRYKMENLFFSPDNILRYKNYYFSKDISIESFIKNRNGIHALHNSITPDVYKKMNQIEFLNQDILLSKIFKVLL